MQQIQFPENFTEEQKNQMRLLLLQFFKNPFGTLEISYREDNLWGAFGVPLTDIEEFTALSTALLKASNQTDAIERALDIFNLVHQSEEFEESEDYEDSEEEAEAELDRNVSLQRGAPLQNGRSLFYIPLPPLDVITNISQAYSRGTLNRYNLKSEEILAFLTGLYGGFWSIQSNIIMGFIPSENDNPDLVEMLDTYPVFYFETLEHPADIAILKNTLSLNMDFNNGRVMIVSEILAAGLAAIMSMLKTVERILLKQQGVSQIPFTSNEDTLLYLLCKEPLGASGTESLVACLQEESNGGEVVYYEMSSIANSFPDFTSALKELVNARLAGLLDKVLDQDTRMAICEEYESLEGEIFDGETSDDQMSDEETPMDATQMQETLKRSATPRAPNETEDSSKVPRFS